MSDYRWFMGCGGVVLCLSLRVSTDRMFSVQQASEWDETKAFGGLMRCEKQGALKGMEVPLPDRRGSSEGTQDLLQNRQLYKPGCLMYYFMRTSAVQDRSGSVLTDAHQTVGKVKLTDFDSRLITIWWSIDCVRYWWFKLSLPTINLTGRSQTVHE